MARVHTEDFGNPSSVHYYGQRAKAILDEARSAVAELVGGEPSEVVFTSGGTEADNFAIRGVAESLEPTGRRHLVATTIEHEAVLNTLKALARRGWRTTLVPGRRQRPRRSGARRRGDGRRHGARVGDARQQRDRHDSAGRRDRRERRGRAACSCTPTPCSRSARFLSTRRRSASICFAVGSQVQRAEGRRSAVDSPRHAPDGDPDRRAARAEPPRWNGERGRDRRPRRRRTHRTRQARH